MRTRYMTQWDQIEARFLDAPEEAVRQGETFIPSTDMLRKLSG